MQRLDINQLADALALTPSEEAADGMEISLARVAVADGDRKGSRIMLQQRICASKRARSGNYDRSQPRTTNSAARNGVPRPSQTA
jgi:hypothetical protein